MTAIAYPGGGITYTYDAAGQRTGMTDSTGTTTWTFDAAGRTTAIAAPQGTVGYAYNAAGERTSMSLPGGRMLTYAYDATSGRLTSLTDWAARTTTFGYDSEGRRTTFTRPNGVVSTVSHDAAGRRTAISHTRNGVTVQSFTATYDAAGNRTSVTGAVGAETYTYDALGRITAVTYPGGGGTATYTYDAHGNRLTRTQGGVTTNYTYDDADQLVSDGTNSFVYDAAGNLTTSGSQTYTWDWNGRMTSATVSGTTTTYTYDGDDVRTGRTQGGTTNFLWDRESGLPLLVDDGSFGYVYAGETPLDQISAGGTASSLLLDPLGSVRGLADGNGALSGTRDYDVYGALRASSGSYGRLGFTGEQMDAETGFVFLRARYHDPVTGRFLSRDSVQPNGLGSQAYHHYTYGMNNPATWTDPSGYMAAAALGTASMLVGLQTGLSQGSDPLKAHSVAMIIAAQMAATVAITYQTISAFQQLGVLEMCSADDACGRVLERAVSTIEGVFNHPDPGIRKMLESIFRAFPMARMGVYLSVGTFVIETILECILSGRCKPYSQKNKGDCSGYPENGPYWMLDGLAFNGRFTWTDFDKTGRLRKYYRSASTIRSGYPYKDWQKAMIYGANLLRNNGVLRDDVTGDRLATARASRHAGKDGMKGTASVDHRCPEDRGGSNSFGNACVVEFNTNSIKRTKIPDRDYCTWWSVLSIK